MTDRIFVVVVDNAKVSVKGVVKAQGVAVVVEHAHEGIFRLNKVIFQQMEDFDWRY